MALLEPERVKEAYQPEAVPNARLRFIASDNDSSSGSDGYWLACLFHPVVAGWVGVLKRLAISPENATQLASRAAASGSDFQSELAASGLASEARLIAAM